MSNQLHFLHPPPSYQLKDIAVTFNINKPEFGWGTSLFPIYALPTKLQRIVTSLCKHYMVPPEMVFASLMSITSLAAQSQYKVKSHNGGTLPVTLWFLTIAESGMGKSTIMKAVSGTVDKIVKKVNALQASSQAEGTSVKPSKKGLIKLIRLIYQDSTPEAMIRGLKHWPSAMLASSEGGSILNARPTGNQPLLCSLWSNEDYTVNRVKDDDAGEEFVLENAFLTLNLMVQPAVYEQFMKTNRGKLSSGNGLTARTLPTKIDSSKWVGTRLYEPGTPHLDECVEAVKGHDACIEEIYLGGIDECGALLRSPTVLSFEGTANEFCRKYANDVEQNMRLGSPLSDITDAASRSAEQMMRIAAIFHIYEGKEDRISMDTTVRAAEVALWYLGEYKRLYSTRSAFKFHVPDDQELDNWLQNKIRQGHFVNTPESKGWVQKYAPNCMRSSSRLNVAIQSLQNQNKVWVQKVGKAEYLFVVPDYIGYVLRQNQNQPIQPPIGVEYLSI